MSGKAEYFTLEGRNCACYVPKGPEPPLPLCVLCGWDLADKLPLLAEGLPPMALFWAEIDGDRDFTPWPAPPVWEGEIFSGEASAFLDFLTSSALPYVQQNFGISPDPARRALLGYSLGGLFALWAMGQTEAFSLFGSLSGSTWYDGFLPYLRELPLRDQRVYLSLGDREEFGGPPRMRAVGTCTRETAAFLGEKLPDTVLEWNKGGHGKGVQTRWKRALAWTARRIVWQRRNTS